MNIQHQAPSKQEKLLLFFVTMFIFLLCVLLSYDKMLNDADTAWHIQAGKDIISDGYNTADKWAFTIKDYSWLNISWLADVIFAKLYHWFDISGVYLLITLLLITTIYVLISAMLKESGLYASFVVVVFGLIAIFPILTLRPHIISLLFTALFFIKCRSFAENKISATKLLITLPLLTALWANMHGGFILAFIITGTFFIEGIFTNKKTKTYLILAILCLLATFANPLGISIYEGVWRTLGGPMKDYITEWQPIKFNKLSSISYIYVIGVIFLISYKNKDRVADYILSTLWVMAALMSSRNIGTLVIFSAPLMANILHSYITDSQVLSKRCRYYKDKLAPYQAKLLSVIGAALIVMSLGIIQSLKDTSIKQKAPYDEIMHLNKYYSGLNIFNHYNYGGYLALYSDRKYKYFIDGRAETAFPPQVIKDNIEILNLSPGWVEILEKYQFDAALVPNKKNDYLLYNIFKTAGWKVMYIGDKATILAPGLEPSN